MKATEIVAADATCDGDDSYSIQISTKWNLNIIYTHEENYYSS